MEDNNEMELREILCESVEQIQIAEDFVQWADIFDKVLNLRVPYDQTMSWLAEQPSDFQGRLCAMQLV